MAVTQWYPPPRFPESAPPPPIGTYVSNRTLAAGVAETVTVPAGATSVIVSGDATMWARIGGTAAVPTGDVTDGTGSVCLQTWAYRACTPGGTISVVAGATAHVSFEWFLAPGR